MKLTIFAGQANRALAEAVAKGLGTRLGNCLVERFPDGEAHVEVQESVRGHDVYLIQPTSPPADAHLLELLLLADACRRAGAARLTAVTPYFAYARQDRRAGGREAVAARLIADLMKASGLDRVVAVDLHAAALEGFFAIPLEHLSAVSTLAGALPPAATANGVVVAPDLGAVKLAERYARLLRLPVAIVHKTRLSGHEVRAHGVIGEVRGRSPLVVDDMISTGGTVEAAIKAVLEGGCAPEVTVVATHALLVGPAIERLQSVPMRRLIATDSVPGPVGCPLPLHTMSLSSLLAEAIRRLHTDASLSDLLVHG